MQAQAQRKRIQQTQASQMGIGNRTSPNQPPNVAQSQQNEGPGSPQRQHFLTAVACAAQSSLWYVTFPRLVEWLVLHPIQPSSSSAHFVISTAIISMTSTLRRGAFGTLHIIV